MTLKRTLGPWVLYMVDPIDARAVLLLNVFDGKKLKSTTKGSEVEL